MRFCSKLFSKHADSEATVLEKLWKWNWITSHCW